MAQKKRHITPRQWVVPALVPTEPTDAEEDDWLPLVPVGVPEPYRSTPLSFFTAADELEDCPLDPERAYCIVESFADHFLCRAAKQSFKKRLLKYDNDTDEVLDLDRRWLETVCDDVREQLILIGYHYKARCMVVAQLDVLHEVLLETHPDDVKAELRAWVTGLGPRRKKNKAHK